MYKELDTVLEWAQDGKWKSLHGNPQMIDAAITQFHALLEAAQHSARPTVLPAREIEIICPNCNLVIDVPVPAPHSG